MSRVSASRSNFTRCPRRRRACSRSPPARSTAPASSGDAFPVCRRPGAARCRGVPSANWTTTVSPSIVSYDGCRCGGSGRGAAADVPTPPDAPEQGGRDGHAHDPGAGHGPRLGEDPKDPQAPPLGFSGHARAAPGLRPDRRARCRRGAGLRLHVAPRPRRRAEAGRHDLDRDTRAARRALHAALAGQRAAAAPARSGRRTGQGRRRRAADSG